MKRRIFYCLLCASMLLGQLAARTDTSVDPTDRFSWGSNFGWMNWRGDVENGAVFTRKFASGYVWAANVGWINLGSIPQDGEAYANDSGNDFGVNVDYTSDAANAFLTGYAWSANAGWVNFDIAASAGAANRPRINKTTGLFSGYAWSANLGWISLNSSVNHRLVTTFRLITLAQAHQHILGITMLTGEEFDQADANSDGEITIEDLVLLVNMGF